MKKLILVALLALFSACVIADTIPVNTAVQTETVVQKQDLQEFTISKIWDGVKGFWNYLNWVFIVAFIIISGVFNMYVSAENKAEGMNWFRKVPMAIWIFLIGIILAAIFIFAFDIKTIKEITGLLFSIVFSMGIYKIGIDKFIKFLAEKFGLKLNK